MSDDISAEELAWQARWKAAGLGKAPPGRRGPKFMLVFAYPGPSGFLHLGHMRGYSYADAIARYHRMKGEAVFFPGGTHASGLPAVTFAMKVARGDPDIIAELASLGLDPEAIRALEKPETAARFLGENYWNLWEGFGMLMDRSSYLTTIDPDYQRFITWQFNRLHKLGLLTQKPHYAPYCPRSGPVSVDPSETDLSSGGNAEVVAYTLLPFKLSDGRELLAATLRPETVYGATNLWVPASGTLIEWIHEGRKFLVTRAGLSKLIEQNGGVAGGECPTSSLLDRKAKAPLTGEELPIFESALVDERVATGVVMSVPAHAPADWVALTVMPGLTGKVLRDSARTVLSFRESSLSPSERELMKGEGVPAARAVYNLAVESLDDHERLAEATERVYRLEHRVGVMSIGPHSGETVVVARGLVGAEVFGGKPLEIREFTETVICRCGEEVIIRKVPDQWFIRYGSKEWKSQAMDLIGRMVIHPEDYGKELPKIMDWFEDRPAVRRGKWLGTPFPVDPSWVIEPIADSTLYPAYYIIRRFISEGRLQAEDLTQEFFDFVFLGEGEGNGQLSSQLMEEARADFQYWYPLDLNLGGKEHKRVHFPVFIFNHAALLPKESQPKGIFVNWWLTNYSGDKISKRDQKGGAVPTPDRALKEWGADGIRLFYATAASTQQDVQWDEETCHAARRRLNELIEMISQMAAAGPVDGVLPELVAHEDRWLSTRVHDLIVSVRDAFDNDDIRSAAQEIYVNLAAISRRYRNRGGANPQLLRKVAGVWCALLSPITPHAAEEVHSRIVSGESLVAAGSFPTPEEFRSYPDSLEREALIEQIEEDLGALVKVWKGEPKEITIFVAAEWKYDAERILRETTVGGRVDMKAFMQRSREGGALASRLPELPKYASEAKSSGVSAAGPLIPRAEELSSAREASDYLTRRFGVSKVHVYLEEEGNESNDPSNRRSRSRPGKPALNLA